MFFGWRDGGSYHQQIADEPILIYYGYPQWNPLTDVTPEVTPKVADEPTLIYYGYPQWNPLTDVTPEVTPKIADEPTLIYYGYPQWNPLTDVTPEVTPKSPIVIPEPNPESVFRPVPDNAVSAEVPVIHQNLVMRYLM